MKTIFKIAGFAFFTSLTLNQEPARGNPEIIDDDKPQEPLRPVAINAPPLYDQRRPGLRTDDNFPSRPEVTQRDGFLVEHETLKTSIGLISVAHDEDEIPKGWRKAEK